MRLLAGLCGIHSSVRRSKSLEYPSHVPLTCPRVIEIDERVGFEQDPVMGSCSVHRLPINSDKTLSRAAGGEPRSTACRQQWLLHSTMAGPSAKRTATAIIEGRLGASKCTISEMLA